MGNNQKGLKIYRQGLLLSRQNYSPIWRDYGVVLAHSGYNKRGLWFLEKYCSHHPSDINSLFFIANNLIAQRKPDQAAVYIDRLLSQASASRIKEMTKKMYDKSNIYYLLLDKNKMKEIVYRRIASEPIPKTG